MKRRRMSAGMLLSVVMAMVALALIVIMFAFDKSADVMNKIVAAIAVVSGISSIILGISSIFSATLDNVREYFVTGDTPEHSSTRSLLYKYRDFKRKTGKTIYSPDFDEAAGKFGLTAKKEDIEKASSFICNFFHLWGLLAKKRFLPMWVFESSSGFSVVKLYEAVEDIIKYNIEESNLYYAENFKWLKDKIESKYKKEIDKCRENEQNKLQAHQEVQGE